MDGYPNRTASGRDLGRYSRFDGRRRWRDLVWLPALVPLLAFLVVLLLVLGLLAVGCGLVGLSLLPSPSHPQAILRALVSADGRHVVVPSQIKPGCSRVQLSVTESPRKVVLSLSQKTTDVLPCAEVVGLGTATGVLSRPLSGRVMTDSATGRPVRHFDGRNLDRVGYIPAGYRPSGDTRLAFSSGLAANSWTRAFIGRGPERLEVTQALPPSQVLVTYPVTQHTVVNGHQAAMGENTENGRVDARAVTWSADGYAFAVVSETSGRAFTPLPASELLHVAQSVQR